MSETKNWKLSHLFFLVKNFKTHKNFDGKLAKTHSFSLAYSDTSFGGAFFWHPPASNINRVPNSWILTKTSDKTFAEEPDISRQLLQR